MSYYIPQNHPIQENYKGKYGTKQNYLRLQLPTANKLLPDDETTHGKNYSQTTKLPTTNKLLLDDENYSVRESKKFIINF